MAVREPTFGKMFFRWPPRQLWLLPLVVAVVYSLIAVLQSPALACSRMLWNENPDQMVVGRTMDWGSSLDDNLYIIPRGLTVHGGTETTPLTWTVKYGSVTSSISQWLQKQGAFTVNDGAADGINEKGFAAHFLYLSGSQYEERDPARPGVSTLRWVRYLLDNFATVEEALAGMDRVQIVPAQIDGNPMDFHVAMEDPTGDSAIIEYINGKRIIHHGRDITVMTNSPPYDAQMKELKRYKPFGGDTILPGNIGSIDRFVRLKYFSRYIPRTKEARKGTANVLSIMRTVVSPIGAPYPNGATYPTWWVSVADLTNKTYHYVWVENPEIIKVDLNTIDFSKGSGIRYLDPRRPNVNGLANALFKPLN